MKIDWAQLIINTYTQSWFLWVGFLIVGFLLMKFSEQIGFDRRDVAKKEKAGITMISVGITMHLFVSAALISKI